MDLKKEEEGWFCTDGFWIVFADAWREAVIKRTNISDKADEY